MLADTAKHFQSTRAWKIDVQQDEIWTGPVAILAYRFDEVDSILAVFDFGANENLTTPA